MTWLLIVLLVGLILLAGILWVPLQLIIDSDNREYAVKIKGLLQVALLPEEGHFKVKVPFYSFKVQPPGKKDQALTVKPDRKKGSSPWIRNIWGLARDLVRSFHIQRLRLDIDTEDYVTNAQLVPLFLLLSLRDNVRLTTNFQGVFSIYLLVENRLVRVIPTVFRHVIFSK